MSRVSIDFDSTSPNFQKDDHLNWLFLLAVERLLNVRLASQGNLFLNEVYDELGLPRTSQGAREGWLSSWDGVDFEVDRQDRNRGYVRFYVLTSGDIWDRI